MRTLAERILAKVAVPTHDLKQECWLWTAAKSLKRYGETRPVIRDGTRVRLVSRVVCEWVNGPPPSPEHHAGHTCPNGEHMHCISPFHLEWQTPLENQQRRDRMRPRTPSLRHIVRRSK